MIPDAYPGGSGSGSEPMMLVGGRPAAVVPRLIFCFWLPRPTDTKQNIFEKHENEEYRIFAASSVLNLRGSQVVK